MAIHCDGSSVLRGNSAEGENSAEPCGWSRVRAAGLKNAECSCMSPRPNLRIPCNKFQERDTKSVRARPAKLVYKIRAFRRFSETPSRYHHVTGDNTPAPANLSKHRRFCISPGRPSSGLKESLLCTSRVSHSTVFSEHHPRCVHSQDMRRPAIRLGGRR